MSRRLVALLAPLALAALVSACGDGGGFNLGETGFYAPPDPLPPGPPGELIRSDPVPGAPPGVRVWRVLYHSRTNTETDIAVSGLIAAPEGPAPAGGFPVVAFAHGTTGINQRCATSIEPFRERDWYLGNSFYTQYMSLFVQAGYVVAATDYQGLGSPGLGSFLVGRIEGQNVLDAARAARQLHELELSPVNFVAGHSQGGHAAGFAAQIAPTYAPELGVLGAVLIAPAAELTVLLSGVTAITSPTAGTSFLAMAISSYAQNYTALSPTTVMTTLGVSRLPELDTTCYEEATAPFLSGPPSDFIRTPTPADWLAAAQQNTLGRTRTTAPILMLQGTDDSTIPPITNGLFCVNAQLVGDTIKFTLIPGQSHSGVVHDAITLSLPWLQDRIDGKPAPTGCLP